ncbi:hypothetical protein ZIOFF_035098 [Zingiber officinale]|uniref:F-box domain-containing protein n=1 Tax=Zingiber officinale TaxID=94328 RepID=A0A8J5L6W1_ZINOF|nr:hypothetical protein ZIOFF_035098 [Zingiber officinale]
MLQNRLREEGWVHYPRMPSELIQYHKGPHSNDLISLPRDFSRLSTFHMHDIVVKCRNVFAVRKMSISLSEISMDLLYLILSKLSIPYLFRCSAVCSRWFVVVDEVCRSHDDQHLRSHGLCRKAESSLTEKIVGSAIVMMRSEIDLPPIPTMYNWNLMAMKASLSSDPSRCGDYKVVFVFFCPFEFKNFLFFVSAGDEKWTMIPRDLYYYANIAFHDGKLYAVDRGERAQLYIRNKLKHFLALASWCLLPPAVMRQVEKLSDRRKVLVHLETAEVITSHQMLENRMREEGWEHYPA